MTLGADRIALIVVGASLGGLSALKRLLGALPAGYRLPVVVVQHRAADSDDLAPALQRACAVAVREVEDRDPLRPGTVYLAPADYHVLVEDNHLTLSTEARVLHARPSIDVLFESAAASHGPGVLAVVLTGASRDSVAGALEVKRRGGRVVVQDPSGAEAKLMPSSVIAEVEVERVLPLDQIAAYLALQSVAG